MGSHQWEQGAVTLPSAAVAPLKQALRRAQNEMYDAVLEVVRRWEPRYVDQKPRPGYLVQLPEPRGEVEEHAYQAISGRFHRRAGKGCLGRLVASDLEMVVGPRATNRTIEFSCWPVTVRIDGRELSWVVAESKGGADASREEFLGRTVLRFLSGVTWTRGTGGIFFGNDEYNEDAWGSSGDYVTASWGPLGKERDKDFAGFGRYR